MQKDNIPYIIIASFVALSILYKIIRYGNLRKSVIQLLAWIAIIFVIIVCYAFRNEAKYFGNRILGVIAPNYSWTDQTNGSITIARNPDGHFYIDAYINGKQINFMIDTGASSISLSKQDAKSLGFDLSKLTYNKEFSTANGLSLSAPVSLDEFRVGGLSLRNVRAYVGLGDLDVSLLGMSIIERFGSFKIDGDLLILTQGAN